MAKKDRYEAYKDVIYFAAASIGSLTTLNKEVLVELFRDSSLRLNNLYNGANSAGLALNSMIDVLSSEIEKIHKDINDLEIFINNYEYISGKDDLYNANYIEKFDITEEKVRLKNHLNYFTESINSKDSNGKKLGFISQEMGREINTIGSKANYAPMQKLVVQMKDELEKIKEQLLNVL